MFDSDTDKNSSYRLKAAIILLGVLAAAISVGLVWQIRLGYNDFRQYERSANTEPSYGICLKIPSLADLCPDQQSDRKSEKQKSDDDLAAQQEMADWAFLVAVISVAGFWTSLIGLYVIYATFKQTSEAVKVTNRQLVIENRPWIRIEPREASAMVFDANGGRIQFEVLFNNIGNSPALKLSMNCHEFDFFAKDIVADIERFKAKVVADFLASEQRGQTVFPNETGRARGAASVNPQTILASIIDPNRPRVRLFSASFIFSVVYQSAIDDTLFQTTIVMNLDEDEPSGMMKSIPIDDLPIPGPIPFMQMRLSVYPGTYEAT